MNLCRHHINEFFNSTGDNTNEKFAGYYGYDANGERVYKLTGIIVPKFQTTCKIENFGTIIKLRKKMIYANKKENFGPSQPKFSFLAGLLRMLIVN